MNAEYTALKDLYFSLNPEFLQDLEKHCIETSKDMHECGDIFHDYTLESLIKKFSEKYPNDLSPELLNELKECNSIACMPDYYELIDYMLSDIDI